LLSLLLVPQAWGDVPPKRRRLYELNDITTQKTSVRALNLVLWGASAEKHVQKHRAVHVRICFTSGALRGRVSKYVTHGYKTQSVWYSNLKKQLLLDIFSTNQHWCTRPIALPVRRNLQHKILLSGVSATSAPQFQPLRHQRNVSHTAVNRFRWKTLCIEPFCPQQNAQQNAAIRQPTPQPRSPLWLLKPASEHAHARLLPSLSWSWTVLLPSDTHRKTITSIAAVLLPRLTCLLTLPRT
jgi:hypothetical protein